MQGEAQNAFEDRRGILQISGFIISACVLHSPAQELFQADATEVPNGGIASGDQSVLQQLYMVRDGSLSDDH